ncbi:MAG: peptidoglycan editing factor PgeF [Tepidisphaera sp.]|nr:peptidoglycan editing factor PgeF [Tepidisphaera sp.]
MLKSAVLAQVPHAFSTRVGGVSAGPFASLNFGNPMELPPGVARDPVENINVNFRRVLEVIGVPERRVQQVYQVHGCAVRVYRAGDAPREWTPQGEFDHKADAMVTDDPGRVLAVRVADCVPVLLASGDGRVVGAVHAGWRGVVLGVLPAAVEAMLSLGARDIRAAIGPCIGPTRFEVGPEVVAEFAPRWPGAVREHPEGVPGKAMIDLALALRDQLAEVEVSSVDAIQRCTASEPEWFFSHRRDRGITGRMVGVIGPTA